MLVCITRNVPHQFSVHNSSGQFDMEDAEFLQECAVVLGIGERVVLRYTLLHTTNIIIV